MPVISALERLRQENHEFEGTLGYIVKACLKKKEKKSFFFFYYSYVHTRLGSFLPTAPTPSLTTHSIPSLSPPILSRNYFALISNFVVERV
jgi:hypothetical protein